MVDWTDKLVSEVAAMLREGLSAAQVARRMSVTLKIKISKNSIVGMCHRRGLKLNGRKPSLRLEPKAKAAPKPSAGMKAPVKKKEKPRVTELSGHCQWLHGEATDRNFCQSPAVRIEGARFSSTSWCLEHAKVVYSPPKPNSREMIRLNEPAPKSRFFYS